MRGPAWWRRFRAFATGYFWIPCPLCGEMFAGYEEPSASIPTEHEHTRKIICPACAREGHGQRFL